mmetsp:Transcript_18972/g.32443  ORF Transcript_18972/g.32443 Transcript_18972/m.32443 type:complete len:286 (+) Transcript_18972:32-889(+)
MTVIPELEPLLDSFRAPLLAGADIRGLVLVERDGHLTPQGWGILAGLLSAAVSLILYKFSRYVTPTFFPIYRQLSTTDQRNWDSRYSSNVHSALCLLFAYDLLWRGDFFWKEGDVPMILRTNATTFAALGISFGYFLIDFVSTFKYNMGGAEMVLHHLGSLLSVGVALLTGQGHMHTVWMLVTEFTTPLINNRWWLDKMEMKTSPLYVWNGIAVLVSWVVARLAQFPPFFWVIWQTRDQVQYLHPVSVFLMMCVPGILAILNCYWFTKIVKGAYKIVFGAKAKAE